MDPSPTDHNPGAIVAGIDQVLDDLESKAKSVRTRAEFLESVVSETVILLDADGAAIFQRATGDFLILEIGGDGSALSTLVSEHRTAIAKTVAGLDNDSRRQSFRFPNDSDGLLTLFHAHDHPELIMVTWFRNRPSPEFQNLVFGFQEAVAEVLSEFENRLAAEGHVQQRESFQRLHDYSVALSESKSLKTTSISVANFAPGLLSAKRTFVLQKQGNRFLTLAVSGTTKVNRGGDEIRFIEKLVAGLISKSTQDLILSNSADFSSEENSDFPFPAKVQQQYLEANEGFSIIRLNSTQWKASGSETEFVLFSEHDLAQMDSSRLAHVTELLAPMTANTLERAWLESRIPFRNFLNWMATGRRQLLGSLTRAMLTILVVALLASLFILQRQIVVNAQGVLVPGETKVIFAPETGKLINLTVSDGDAVERGQMIAELVSKDLNLRLQTLEGERTAEIETRKSLELALAAAEVTETPSSQIDRIRLSGEIKSSQQKIASCDQQIAYYSRVRDSLTITSPIAGIVVAWDAETLLENRPFNRGEPILKIVGNSETWYADLAVHPLDIPHLFRDGKWKTETNVSVVPATRTDARLSAAYFDHSEVIERNPVNSVPSMRIRVLLDAPPQRDMKAGASVSASLQGESVSLFYSWFYRAIQRIQYEYL